MTMLAATPVGVVSITQSWHNPAVGAETQLALRDPFGRTENQHCRFWSSLATLRACGHPGSAIAGDLKRTSEPPLFPDTALSGFAKGIALARNDVSPRLSSNNFILVAEFEENKVWEY